MNLDWGQQVEFPEGVYQVEELSGKVILTHSNKPIYEINKPYYDPEFNFIPDGSVIDGYGAQDIRYFEHRLDEVREWLKVKPLDMPDDLCVCNFRGGEYVGVPELFLPLDYWNEALGNMKYKYPNIKFIIHTDDAHTAEKMFSDIPIHQGIEKNWQSIRYAKHLIISNSAFAILPALLNENVKEVIAPFGWNARNASQTEWKGRSSNYYKKFTYI